MLKIKNLKYIIATCFFVFFLILSDVNAQALANITNLDDFNYFRYQGKGDLEGDRNLCVFSDTGKYSINIQGSNGGFFLNDNLLTIPFTVKWHDRATPNNATQVTHNVTLPSQTGAATDQQFCLNGNVNSNLSISFDENDLKRAASGKYTGYITIIVEAQY